MKRDIVIIGGGGRPKAHVRPGQEGEGLDTGHGERSEDGIIGAPQGELIEAAAALHLISGVEGAIAEEEAVASSAGQQVDALSSVVEELSVRLRRPVEGNVLACFQVVEVDAEGGAGRHV